MLELKDKAAIEVKAGSCGISLLKNDKPVFFEGTVPFTVCRFKVDKDKVYIDAFLRCAAFSFAIYFRISCIKSSFWAILLFLTVLFAIMKASTYENEVFL